MMNNESKADAVRRRAHGATGPHDINGATGPHDIKPASSWPRRLGQQGANLAG